MQHPPKLTDPQVLCLYKYCNIIIGVRAHGPYLKHINQFSSLSKKIFFISSKFHSTSEQRWFVVFTLQMRSNLQAGIFGLVRFWYRCQQKVFIFTIIVINEWLGSCWCKVLFRMLTASSLLWRCTLSQDSSSQWRRKLRTTLWRN